jgi:hypothetical protein
MMSGSWSVFRCSHRPSIVLIVLPSWQCVHPISTVFPLPPINIILPILLPLLEPITIIFIPRDPVSTVLPPSSSHLTIQSPSSSSAAEPHSSHWQHPTINVIRLVDLAAPSIHNKRLEMHSLPTIVFSLDHHQHEGRSITKSSWQFLQHHAAITTVTVALVSRLPRSRSTPPGAATKNNNNKSQERLTLNLLSLHDLG